ncbi:MAG: SAM hydroxide adenosyltransferase [Candidatus Moraniibacteriota bacterium]
MIVTIINDCSDDNAVGRQVTRTSSILQCPVNYIRVNNEIEAAGNLIDALDALEERQGVILVNVAPRDAKAKKWKNGSPFGYFKYKNALIISTIDGLSLSLVKKLKLTNFINNLNIPVVVESLFKKGYITAEQKEYIINTQFRSFDFLPRIAEYIIKEKEVESDLIAIEEFAEIGEVIWWIDNFGNCKTTFLEEELPDNIIIKETYISHYKRLKDVPDKQAAFITGSSGLEKMRFVEIVVQGGSAKNYFDLSVGDKLI